MGDRGHTCEAFLGLRCRRNELEKEVSVMVNKKIQYLQGSDVTSWHDLRP